MASAPDLGAPMEHTVRYLPFEKAVAAGVEVLAQSAELHARSVLEHGELGVPSVLSPASTELNNAYVPNTVVKTRASSHPLYFACVIGGVRWRFYQGADPLGAAATRGFVTHRLQPHVAVRLNEWPMGTPETRRNISARVHGTYGARCLRVLYVPDLLPEHIRETDDASGKRELALALMLHTLFEELIAILAAWPEPTSAELASPSRADDDGTARSSSSESSSGEDASPEGGEAPTPRVISVSPAGNTKLKRRFKRAQASRDIRTSEPPVRAVYIHCAAGKERSRFVTVALHGALYMLASRAYSTEQGVPLPLTSLAAMHAWSDRQSCFGNNALSLKSLLTHNSDVMFAILTTVVARLSGLTKPGDLDNARRMLERAACSTSIRGNYHNVCASGAGCARRSTPEVKYICSRCHVALFCSMDCVMQSQHVQDQLCSQHFHVHQDAPLLLRASALEKNESYREIKRSRARAGTGTIVETPPPSLAQPAAPPPLRSIRVSSSTNSGSGVPKTPPTKQ
jgi:hypothetical protein